MMVELRMQNGVKFSVSAYSRYGVEEKQKFFLKTAGFEEVEHDKFWGTYMHTILRNEEGDTAVFDTDLAIAGRPYKFVSPKEAMEKRGYKGNIRIPSSDEETTSTCAELPPIKEADEPEDTKIIQENGADSKPETPKTVGLVDSKLG